MFSCHVLCPPKSLLESPQQCLCWRAHPSVFQGMCQGRYETSWNHPKHLYTKQKLSLQSGTSLNAACKPWREQEQHFLIATLEITKLRWCEAKGTLNYELLSKSKAQLTAQTLQLPASGGGMGKVSEKCIQSEKVSHLQFISRIKSWYKVTVSVICLGKKLTLLVGFGISSWL